MVITQKREFECCYISETGLNAHRYRIDVTVSGNQRYVDTGQVISFEQLSEYIRMAVPDKYWVYGEASSLDILNVVAAIKTCKIPTWSLPVVSVSCEKLCERIASKLQLMLDQFEPGVIVEQVKLVENSTSYALWRRSSDR